MRKSILLLAAIAATVSIFLLVRPISASDVRELESKVRDRILAERWSDVLSLSDQWSEADPAALVPAWLAWEASDRLSREDLMGGYRQILIKSKQDKPDSVKALALWIAPLVEDHRDESVLWELASSAFIWAGDYPRAVAAAQEADDRGSSPAAVHKLLGNAALAQGRLDVARRELDLAVAEDNRDTALFEARGALFRRMGLWDEAVADFETMTRICPRSASGWAWVALAEYERKGDLSKIVEFATRAIELEIDDWSVYRARGIALGMLERRPEAVADLTKAIDMGGNDAFTAYSRGVVWLELGESQKAADDFSRATTIVPVYGAAHNGRGLALGRLGRRAEALEAFSEALRLTTEEMTDMSPATRDLLLDFDTALTRMSRAGAYLDLGQTDKALADARIAVQEAPDKGDAHLVLANVLRTTGDLTGAIDACTRAIELDPDSAKAFCRRGLIREDAEDFAGALEDFTEAVRLDPDDSRNHLNRGRLNHALGNLTAAIDDFAAGLRFDPFDVDLRSARAEALAESGDIQAALRDVEAALEVSPDDPVLWLSKGLKCAQTGRTADAIRAVEKFIELVPGTAFEEFLPAAREKLEELQERVAP